MTVTDKLIEQLRDEDSYYRIQEKHWCIDSEELERQRLAAADRIEQLTAKLAEADAVLELQNRDIARLREALDMLDQQSEALGGCSDGSCVIHRPKGMHTNGGCRCWDDRDKMRRWTQYVGYFRHKARVALEGKQ